MRKIDGRLRMGLLTAHHRSRDGSQLGCLGVALGPKYYFDLAREFESCTRCPLKGELTASSMYQRAWNGVSFGSGLTLDRVSL